jgi:hypothetical protein
MRLSWRESSAGLELGDEGGQVCLAQSTDIELRALRGAEQRLFALFEEVQSLDQAIVVAADPR